MLCRCAMSFHGAKAGAYPKQTSESGNNEGSSNCTLLTQWQQPGLSLVFHTE